MSKGAAHVIAGADLARALELRAAGWSFARIGREFGASEGAATNAVVAAQCVTAGFAPAKRDPSGALYPKEIKRLRGLIMQGLRGVEIQLQMAISASSVSHHRARLKAELKKHRKGNTIPVPGGGEQYSGRRVPAEAKAEAVRLLLTGLGTPSVSAKSGVSKTQVTRIRAKLVKKLARNGECLPGCDIKGVRHHQIASARFILPETVAAFRQRILAREPVLRAAHSVGIGTCTGYRLRDELAAEMAVNGEVLAKPILPGKGRAAERAAAIARWLPKGKRYRFRALARDMGFEAAKLAVLAEAAAESQAEARRPRSFEEQLAASRAGTARFVERVAFHRPDPTGTLAGVTSWEGA